MSKHFNLDNPQTIKYVDGFIGFQGDVVINGEKLPDDFDTYDIIDQNIIAFGEATGHCHQLFSIDNSEFVLKENPKTKERHLKVISGSVMLKHHEHSPIVFVPGEYRIGIAKEYDHSLDEKRQVVD